MMTFTPALYLWVEPTPKDDLSLVSLQTQLMDRLPAHPQNTAYLDALCRPAQPEETRRQRMGALRCFLHLMSAVCPHLLPAMTLHRETSGRPYAAFDLDDTPPLDFSLTHTTHLVACALLLGEGRVGVDIETYIPPRRAEKIARRYFTPAEQAGLQNLAEGAQGQRITRLWTAKEAICKAGGGISPMVCDSQCPPEGNHLLCAVSEDTASILTLCAPCSFSSVEVLSHAVPIIWITD